MKLWGAFRNRWSLFSVCVIWMSGRGRALGMGGHLFASRKNPLCRARHKGFNAEYSIMPSCLGVFSKNPANCQVSCSTTRHNSHASPLVNSNHRRPCAACFTQNFEVIETPLIHGAQQLPCFAHCHLAKLCRALRSRIAHISGELRFSPPPLGIITYSALNPRPGARDVGLRRHRFGSGSRGGFGLGGGAGGLGDAGNEALDQLDRAFHGAAGVGADNRRQRESAGCRYLNGKAEMRKVES
jgi:hypothetical protein